MRNATVNAFFFFWDNTKLAILSLLGIEKYIGVVLAG